MRWEIWGRYFLQLLLCLPAGILCLAPVRGRLRVGRRMLATLVIVAVTLFAALGATVLQATYWPENALLVPALVLFYALYRRFVEIDGFQALFILMVAAAVMGFCAVFSEVLWAREELTRGEEVSSWGLAVTRLGLGAAVAAAFWPLMARRVGWLIRYCGQMSAWRIAWLLPTANLVLFVAMMPQDYRTILVNRVQSLGMVILLFLLGLMAFLIEQFYRIARSMYDSAALRDENHFLAAQASQYAALSSYIQQTRKLRHDFRQHLRVISGLVAKGDLEALNAYLRDVSGQEQEKVRFIFANSALNALAGYYESRARSQGVELEWSVSLPETLNIPDAEICVLLGNLLENALDGAGTMPQGKRRARIICQLNGEMCCVIVENSYNGQVLCKDGRFLSTKHEGRGHGLASVEAVVARHHGSMEVDAEGGIFRVSLLISLAPEGENP